MIRVSIFGTGASAARVWHILEEHDLDEDVQVVAFADNDPARQGATFHGRPVLSAAELAAGGGCDYVLLASQWHAEISAQLAALGVPAGRVIAWHADPRALEDAVAARRAKRPVRAGGASIPRRELPRVLILTHETLNDSHGTGVLLQRYFGDFPPGHLFSVAHQDAGRPWLAQSLRLTSTGACAAGVLCRSLEDARFHPDLVYATALHETDLALLRHALEAVPRGTPVVQHFMDFVPHDEPGFLAQFRGLLPAVTEVWALTEALRDMLAARLGCRVTLVRGLLQHATEARAEHRAFGADFRTAMVGNFYHPAVVGFVREVWRQCRARLPGLGPVEWFVSPARVQDLLDAGVDPGLEFVWRGFFGGRRLLRRLAQADLGLLALNQEETATTNYLRYSLPSRVTEFACAGVPLFAIASRDTPLASFVTQHGIGRTASGPDAGRVTDALVELIQDRTARARAGAAGRRLAARDFRIDGFRDWFNGRLLALSRRRFGGAGGRARERSPEAACERI